MWHFASTAASCRRIVKFQSLTWDQPSVCCPLPLLSWTGIATLYGLYGPGIESRWGGLNFSPTVQTAPGVHLASYTMGTASFTGVKRLWRGVDDPPPSSANVKERVELYIYSPSGPVWYVLGWNLPLPLPYYLPPYCTFLFNFSFRVSPSLCVSGTTWLNFLLIKRHIGA